MLFNVRRCNLGQVKFRGGSQALIVIDIVANFTQKLRTVIRRGFCQQQPPYIFKFELYCPFSQFQCNRFVSFGGIRLGFDFSRFRHIGEVFGKAAVKLRLRLNFGNCNFRLDNRRNRRALRLSKCNYNNWHHIRHHHIRLFQPCRQVTEGISGNAWLCSRCCHVLCQSGL